MARLMVLVFLLTGLLSLSSALPRGRQSKYTNTHDGDIDWNKLAQDELDAVRAHVDLVVQPKNVILFVGDGMGPTTVSAARAYLAQSRHLQDVTTKLEWEKFPVTGLSKTHNADLRVAGSAASATAMFCGEKVNYYTVGASDKVKRKDCSQMKDNRLKSILKHGIDAGKWSGFVTTTRVTHATPASTYASTAERGWEYEVPAEIPGRDECPDIASQMIDNSYARKFRVMMGGGRGRFLPEDEGGVRTDGQNLIMKWLEIEEANRLPEDKYKYVGTKEEFEEIDPQKVDYLLGMFNDDHLEYDMLRRNATPIIEPSLPEMVEKAIRMLSRSTEGYVLMVEGGRIDQGHHKNWAKLALDETTIFSDAVAKAIEMTDADETMIIVTADHAHAFTLGGYPHMDDDILGTFIRDTPGKEIPRDFLPFLILGYQTGEGWYDHRTYGNGTPVVEPNEQDPKTPITRLDVTQMDRSDPKFRYDAMIPGEETHGGEEVGIYASGPSSYLFRGVHHQHYIAHAIMFAMCMGPYQGDACETPTTTPGTTHTVPTDLTTVPDDDNAAITTISNFKLCVAMAIFTALWKHNHRF